MKKKNLEKVCRTFLVISLLSPLIVSSKVLAAESSSTKQSVDTENSSVMDSREIEGFSVTEESQSVSVISGNSNEKTNENPVQKTENITSVNEEIVEEENDIIFSDDDYEYPHNRSDINEADNSNKMQRSIERTSTPSVTVNDKNTPQKNFVDVSSHNGEISVAEYKKMKSYGITGVSVKLTEGTNYKNPYAKSQTKNAMEAGLKVSVYHYSWFINDDQARAEAVFFANYANELRLPKSTLMINDIEEPGIVNKGNHTANSLAFKNKLNQLGFKDVSHYVGAYWITSGKINPDKLGYKNIWVAAYPYTLSTNQNYTEYAAWQWSSKLTIPGVHGTFDISSDYSDKFSQKPQVEMPAVHQGINSPKSGLWYRSHVSDAGWLGFVGTEYLSGTTGQNRRLEAVDVMWNKKKESIRSSFQDINGRWIESGTGITGTTGRALSIQRVCFASNQDILSSGRKIQYRVHSQDVGWSSWKEEGESAGVSGKKIESIEMRMLINGKVEKE